MNNNIYFEIEIDDAENIKKLNEDFRNKLKNIDTNKNNETLVESEIDFTTFTI